MEDIDIDYITKKILEVDLDEIINGFKTLDERLEELPLVKCDIMPELDLSNII